VSFRPNWYESERHPWWRAAFGGWSGVRWVVTLTVGVYALQFAEAGLLHTGWLTEWGGLRAWLPPTLEDLVSDRTHGPFNPFFPVQLFSYALLHAGFWNHLFWNMLFLFFFGPELEAHLGRASFLRLYAGGAVAGGLLQWTSYLAQGQSGSVIGASGAVFTVMVVYALNWPHRQIYIWGLLPIPVWVWVAFSLGANVMGLIGGGEGGTTSFLAHLGGAAFGLLWFRKGDVLQRLAQQRRLAATGRALAAADDDRREMDRILAKIQASGIGSLNGDEREFLERRSRQLRQQGP